MSAPSDPPDPPSSWPAAKPIGIAPIQHPAWEEARNAILDLAAEGPVTAIVVGEPGTGKTWLLHELAASLSDHGFPTMMMLQGNLPLSVSDGAALLVDDASLMDESTRLQLTEQQRGVVVLAGVEWFEDEIDPAASKAVTVRLRCLDPMEVAEFCAEWLHRSGPPELFGPATLTGLAERSGGRVGALVRLLEEAVRSQQQRPEPAAVEREPAPVPAPVLAPVAPPVVPAPVSPPPTTPTPALLRPKRRRTTGPAITAAAIAAAVILGWALLPGPHSTTVPIPSRSLPIADATSQASAPAALPPLRLADTSDPAVVTAAPPPRPVSTTATPATAAASETATAENPALAAAAPPPLLPSGEPSLVATLDPADPSEVATPVPGSRGRSPGLALILQRGDTLERLYDDVYRDRNAPPFATILAANPGPVRPGAVVVFPEPPGGWQRVQR